MASLKPQTIKSMNTSLVRLCVAFAWLAAFGQDAFAAVTFNVTPSAVSNTYSGTITLQIDGLTNKTVVIQKFLDLNTNGVIDGGDLLVQQFTLQDGTNFVIGEVTNFNVPGDLNAATGAIAATLNFQNGDFVQNIIGNYLFKLSNPGGHFEPLTNQFTVTNFPFPQTFTGNVVSNSTSTTLPNAIVLLFPPPRPGNNGPSGNPLAGVVANNAGSYTVQMPPGTYMPVAFEGNYAANMGTAPVLTLAASQTITTNLTLTNATSSISGKVVDANNSSIGLPGVMVPAMSSDGLLAITFTDTNGNFNVPVTAGMWGLKPMETALIVHGYLRLQNGTNVTAGATGVTLTVPKATALIYGSVMDNLGNPLVGIDVEAYDSNNNEYESDGYTGTNGNYVVGVLGGLADDNWQAKISTDSNPANYDYSQNDSTNISAGQAVLQNFTAILATNYITGNVKANGTNIVSVGVNANATINGTNYQTYVDTDANGNYSLNVANGSWSVGVQCYGDSDSLDNILGNGTYQCPDNQTAVIDNNNATNNFTVQPCGSISITTTSLLAGEVGVYYDQSLHASSCNSSHTWTNTAGSLPSGVSLSSDGTLSGTPDTNGTYTFTVQVTDGDDLTTNGQFSIGISNAVQITTTTLPDGTNGFAYSQQLQAAAGVPFGGASPYSWSLAPRSASLPANLILATNGLLSGNAATNGTFDFIVEVADSLGGIYDQPLSLTITTGAPVPDVLFYYVTKLEAFRQLDATNIVLNTNAGPFNAFLGIVQSSLGMVPIATVILPTGAAKGLPWGNSAIEMRSQESFSSQASFDAAYPPGDYAFGLYGLHDGLRFTVLSMPPPAYPDPPHVSNFAAAQSLNPPAAFTLQWDAIPGGTTNDTLWVFITDTNGNPVFSTPYPPMHPVGSLKGTATSVVIPTNTFQFGHAYVGTITFFRMTSVNTTDYPGAVGATVVGVQTWFPLAMASASPVLGEPAKLSGTQFSFQLSGIAGQNYTVLASTNVTLPMSNWFPVLTTNLSTSPAYIEDNQATNAQRFYRVLVGP
jgi:hypothetical protein